MYGLIRFWHFFLESAMDSTRYGHPEKQGLYDPEYEKDACGVGYVVSIDGNASYKVWTAPITILVMRLLPQQCN